MEGLDVSTSRKDVAVSNSDSPLLPLLLPPTLCNIYAYIFLYPYIYIYTLLNPSTSTRKDAAVFFCLPSVSPGIHLSPHCLPGDLCVSPLSPQTFLCLFSVSPGIHLSSHCLPKDSSVSPPSPQGFICLPSVSSEVSLSLQCLPGKLLEEGRRGKKNATP